MARTLPVNLLIVSVIAMLVAISGAACDGKTLPGDDRKRDGPDDSPARRTTTLTLYFGDANGEALVKEIREVTETPAPARAALNALIAGPQTDLEPTLPPGTRLNSVSIVGGTATVDFSRELVDNHPGGSAAERLTVYSIVNTLTEFSTVNSVKITVEGKDVDTIAGHMDTGIVLQRDESVVQR